jgi:hypothetical protein
MAARVVLVAVGALDRRAMCAADYARLLPADDRRAIHVDVDRDDTQALGVAWLEDPPGSLPLDIVDDIGGVAETIGAEVVARVTRGARDVLVVVPRLSVGTVRRRFLHDRTGVRIERVVNGIGRARCIVVPAGVRA